MRVSRASARGKGAWRAHGDGAQNTAGGKVEEADRRIGVVGNNGTAGKGVEGQGVGQTTHHDGMRDDGGRPAAGMAAERDNRDEDEREHNGRLPLWRPRGTWMWNDHRLLPPFPQWYDALPLTPSAPRHRR